MDIAKIRPILEKESLFLKSKYPDHTMCFIHTKHKNSIKLDKNKYLLNNTLTLSDLLKSLKIKLNIEKNHVIYFKINDQKISSDDMLLSIKDILNKLNNNNDNHNYVIIELCRYTKYLNKALNILTLGIL